MKENIRTEEMLARTELCTDLPAAVVRELAGRARRIRASRDQFVVDAGQSEAPVHLVIEGSIRLSVPNIAGNEKTIATLNEGKTFGLAEYFAGRDYRYYAVAQEPSLLVAIPGTVILAVAEREPELLRHLLATMGRQFDALALDIEYSNRFNAFQRVINLLLNNAGRDASGVIRSRLPYKKSVTASRLGLAPETFSRSLATLSERGLISVDNRTITIHDAGRMQALLTPDEPSY